jgi:PKHD-type hydroxylase
MQIKYSYWYFKQAISPEDCRRIIELGTRQIQESKEKGINVEGHTHGFNEKGENPGAAPQGEKTKQELIKDGVKKSYVRDSEVAWLTDEWLYELIHPLINKANKLAGWNWQWDWSEPFQFTVYNPGGFYSWHKDGGGCHNTKYKRYTYGVTPAPLHTGHLVPDGYTTNPSSVGKIRKISMTLSLNPADDYEGGNLKFDFGPHGDEQFHECVEIRPQGSMIVFPSFIDHCVTPVTTGTRYSLVLWSLGDPWK